MSGLLSQSKKLLDRTVEIATAAGLTVMALLLLMQVILRYFFNSPLYWVEELTLLLQIWVVFLGASIVLRKGGHPSLVFLQEKIADALKKPLLILIHVLVGILGFSMFYYGIQMTAESWYVNSPALNLSRGLFIMPVLVGGGLIVLESVSLSVGIFKKT
jgi:TRAP-type C4-dicarboxylate transport system permease small subunit